MSNFGTVVCKSLGAVIQTQLPHCEIRAQKHWLTIMPAKILWAAASHSVSHCINKGKSKAHFDQTSALQATKEYIRKPVAIEVSIKENSHEATIVKAKCISQVILSKYLINAKIMLGQQPVYRESKSTIEGL